MSSACSPRLADSPRPRNAVGLIPTRFGLSSLLQEVRCPKERLSPKCPHHDPWHESPGHPLSSMSRWGSRCAVKLFPRAEGLLRSWVVRRGAPLPPALYWVRTEFLLSSLCKPANPDHAASTSGANDAPEVMSPPPAGSVCPIGSINNVADPLTDPARCHFAN